MKPSNWHTTFLRFNDMTIEIKELHIKINVDESSESSGVETSERNEKDKIIEACVEQVMEILSNKEER